MRAIRALTLCQCVWGWINTLLALSRQFLLDISQCKLDLVMEVKNGGCLWCYEWNSLNETCLANLIIANPQSMDRQKCFFAFVACKDGTFLVNLSGVISLISFTFMNLNCKRHLKGSLHLHHWSGVNPAPSNRGSQELLAQIYQRRQGGLRSPNKRLWSILLLSM